MDCGHRQVQDCDTEIHFQQLYQPAAFDERWHEKLQMPHQPLNLFGNAGDGMIGEGGAEGGDGGATGKDKGAGLAQYRLHSLSHYCSAMLPIFAGMDVGDETPTNTHDATDPDLGECGGAV